MHCQWRGCLEWRDLGLPLSTTSNEASKMYDATLTQYLGFYEDKTEGGVQATTTKMMEADPDFVMGHVLKNAFGVIGWGQQISSDDMKLMVKLAEKSNIQREKDHVKAVKLCAEGQLAEGCDVWKDIAADHPYDALALKLAYHGYFGHGKSRELRDLIARAVAEWKPTVPLYGYIVGMHAFGLEETSLYDKAEETAKKALEINPLDGWSTHALCHVIEMQGRHEEGIAFLSDTIKNWEVSGLLACHNYWHWALYYIEKGDYQSALNIFDNEVGVRSCQSKGLWEIADACSLLYRLEMEGVNVGDRWNDIFEICRPHIEEHSLVFHDVHLLLGCLGAKKSDAVQHLMDSIREFIKSSSGTVQSTMVDIGETICQAFIAYDDGDYAKAVDLLTPIRYNIFKIGGSYAQLDLFNLFLIQAAIKSPNMKHHKLARSLLLERKALKENTPMTDRLLAKTLALHTD